MNKSKTHFEQVPLEIVKEIVGKRAEGDAGGLAAIETKLAILTDNPKAVKGSFKKEGIAKRLGKERLS